MSGAESLASVRDTTTEFVNIAAYQFVTLDRLTERRVELRDLCSRLKLKGTILLSIEGINLFLAGTRNAVDELLDSLRSDAVLSDLTVKESFSNRQPFRRMLVKVKDEIIAFGVEGVDPRQATSPKLPAAELKQWLDEGRPVHLLDTRNDYEVDLGTFESAIPAGIDHFRDFPEAVRRLPESMKDEPIVMFCTGGIRCEKAGPFMEQAGFRKVFQLDGGILKYFEECGQAHYDGDCFVFDERVALDPNLHETGAVVCFGCQMPVTPEQQASPLYVPGESCPNCYRTPDQQMSDRLAERNSAVRVITDPLPGSVPHEQRRPLNVPERFDGATVLDCLAEWQTDCSRDAWRELIEAGKVVRRTGKRNRTRLAYAKQDVDAPVSPVGPDETVIGGERLYLISPAELEPHVNADIEFLHEDDSLVVINKPAPLPVMSSGLYERNTVNFILHQVYPAERLRPAARLDANLSGVLVLTRARSFARQLQRQFDQQTAEQVYLAQVHGQPSQSEFQCDAPIIKNGQSVKTRFKVIEQSAESCVVEARPHNGQSDQVRVHLWQLGFPIVGDPAYLPEAKTAGDRVLHCDDAPMCLQASSVTIQHPQTGQPITFRAPKPSWRQGKA